MEPSPETTTNGEPNTLPISESERISALEAELANASEHILRTQAELDNFRKRTRREMDERQKFATLPLISDILGVLDNLKLAMQAAEKNEESAGLLEGVKLVNQLFLDVLRKHDCQPIPSLGQPFDPNIHQAISMQASTEFPENHVSFEARVGFQLHDRVIRPAQVFVSTGAPK
jgi:molecular chaperone GrpE